MQIVEIRATQPETPGSPPDWRTQLGQIVVEVETSAGLTGIGVGGGGQAGIHVIQTVLRDLLMGSDASEVEARHAEMLAHTAFYGRSGLVVMAISGVDLALWDLRGKFLDQPVGRLLKQDLDLTQSLPTYSTVFEAAEAEQAIRAGHSAIKLHVERFGDRPQSDQIARHVGEVRQRLGPEADIMIDAFARWDLESTLQVADAIAPYNLTWLEEPLPPNDRAGYKRLMRECPVPIAGGEHEYTTAGFQELIDQNLHAVLQPDVNWCGGLTTLIEVYKRASAAGLRVCPHRGCEPFALPAIAALDPMPLAESPRSWFQCLHGVSEIVDGRIQLNDKPGFGVGFHG